MTRGPKPTCFLIKLKGNDVVRLLICRQQKRPGRIDGKVARRPALSGFVSDETQSAGPRVNLEGGDAVMAAVRTIKKSTVRGNVDVRARVLRLKIRRQSRHGLYFSQRALLLVDGEDRYRRVHFIYDIGVLAAGMKSQVPRSRPRLELHPWLFVGNQLSCLCVKAEDHDLVCSEITWVDE